QHVYGPVGRVQGTVPVHGAHRRRIDRVATEPATGVAEPDPPAREDTARPTAREAPPALEGSVSGVDPRPRTRQGSSLACPDAPRPPELTIAAGGKREPSVELARDAAVDEVPHPVELAARARVIEPPLP